MGIINITKTVHHGNWNLNRLFYVISCLINDVQSDLVYPNSLVPIKMISVSETCGLLNHYKLKMVEEVTRTVFGL